MLSQTILRSEKSLRGTRSLYVQDVQDRDYEDLGLQVNKGLLLEVELFCYLGDKLDCEAGVKRGV